MNDDGTPWDKLDPGGLVWHAAGGVVMAVRKRTRRSEGSGAVRQLKSGRWQARYPSADEAMV